MPLVDFITGVLPIKEVIYNNLQKDLIQDDFIPHTIDYACGSGNFLLSYIEKVESLLKEKEIKEQIQRRNIGVKNQFSWIQKGNVTGIEKDYRLAKTTKIASFLNGDGEMEVITGDGINKFDAVEYRSSYFYKNPKGKFDFVISNPPYSVQGFYTSLRRNKINENDFSLFSSLSERSAEIEILFVERAWQLLKHNAYAALILPQSILTGSKYAEARNFILKKFKIRIMILTADITFSGTSTSPVVLIMQKRDINVNEDYNVMCIYSKKYMNIRVKKAEEEKFLGYKLSNSKNKSQINVIENSYLQSLLPIAKEFIHNDQVQNVNNSVSINSLSCMTFGENKEIFPKYKDMPDKKYLKEYVSLRKEAGKEGLKYIEIGSLKGDEIIPSEKKKKGYACKEGDILYSSLTPTRQKIMIADDDYKVSGAIHILRPHKTKDRNYVFDELRKEECLEQANSLVTGFKITYAKISAENLLNLVQI